MMKNSHFDILSKLGGLIKQKRLTETLEAFEHLGFFGEEGITLLIYLQGGAR
jgi:hypothetical protein